MVLYGSPLEEGSLGTPIESSAPPRFDLAWIEVTTLFEDFTCRKVSNKVRSRFGNLIPAFRSVDVSFRDLRPTLGPIH